MTHKERMLAAIQGEPTDRIPWAPRLDLWYNARRRAGTLPPPYQDATLEQILDDLGWGFHAVIPPYRELRHPDDDLHRALGIYNIWTMPRRTVLENVEVNVHRHGDETHVEYRTPAGTVRTTTVYDESMRQAGVSISHVAEHAIKSHQDYDAVGYLFENARVEPNVAGYLEYANRVGGRGIAVANIFAAGSPMHLLQRDLMPVDLFFYEFYDHPEELARCAAHIGNYFERLFNVAADCPAEVFLFGANYDSMIQYPPFFEQHILPWLRTFAEILHPRGKFLLTHTDGENTGLLDLYLASGMNIADSVCPAPMTRLTLKEVRDRFAGRITIMGGIPSVALLEDSMPDADFDAFLDGFFSDIGAGDHLMLGISDTTPPDAALDRIRKIGSRVEQFGPVNVGR